MNFTPYDVSVFIIACTSTHIPLDKLFSPTAHEAGIQAQTTTSSFQPLDITPTPPIKLEDPHHCRASLATVTYGTKTGDRVMILARADCLHRLSAILLFR
jgi:hypothetical protein